MSYRHPMPEQIVTIKGAHIDEGGISQIRTTDQETQQKLDAALMELKITNLHLSIATEEQYNQDDIEE